MRIFSRILCLALVLSAVPALAGRPMQKDEALTLIARPGSWIEADGALRSDGTFVAKEIEVYSPEDSVQTEDITIYGEVRRLNRRRSTLMVLGYRVVFDQTTTIKDANKRRILSSKIKDGMGVKVQGLPLPDGTFRATKIKLHDGKVKDGKFKAKEKIFGPVTIDDARLGRLRIMQTSIELRRDASFVEIAPNPID